MSVPGIPPKPTVTPAAAATPTAATNSEKIPFHLRVQSLGHHLFDIAKRSLSKPYVLLNSIGAAAMTFFAYRQSPKEVLSVEQLTDICDKGVEEEHFVETKQCIHDYVVDFLRRHPTSVPWSNSAVHHLSEKLSTILIDGEHISKEGKLDIIPNVQKDFLSLMQHATERVLQDVDSGALTSLGVDPSCSLKDVICCGSETHNQGKIPLKFIFSNGVEVIYKPRSMQPEHLLYNPESGLFARSDLGSYGIVCASDDYGEYGYSECLANIQADNTMTSAEEVQAYLDKFSKMDKLATELGISDLHCENFVTAHKTPLCIDAEVYLIPTSATTSTGIFDGFGAANTFDPYMGAMPHSTTNRIWFDPSLIAGRNISFTYGMREHDLASIGVTIKDPSNIELPEETLTSLSACRRSLQEHPGRYVLIPTAELKGMLRYLDPYTATPHFLHAIRDNLRNNHFTFEEGATDAIMQGIQEDMLHNDVPIFYYDSRHETMLYHGAVIGRLNH